MHPTSSSGDALRDQAVQRQAVPAADGGPPLGEVPLAPPRPATDGVADGIDVAGIAAETGTRLRSRLSRWRGNFARMLDMLSDGVLLINGVGSVLHQNQATARLLGADPERERLVDDIRRLAQSFTSMARRKGVRRTGEFDAPQVRELRTAHARYRIRIASLRDFLETGEMSIVALQSSAPELPTAEALRERYGLTRQQARVALLLAEGRSNADVARELAISPHTARHHTEEVLNKVGVRSRAELVAKLLRQ